MAIDLSDILQDIKGRSIPDLLGITELEWEEDGADSVTLTGIANGYDMMGISLRYPTRFTVRFEASGAFEIVWRFRGTERLSDPFTAYEALNEITEKTGMTASRNRSRYATDSDPYVRFRHRASDSKAMMLSRFREGLKHFYMHAELIEGNMDKLFYQRWGD